ncbi:MAG: CaiB/BaiF CoA transferase family protein [Dehalococcoidia bacterium]
MSEPAPFQGLRVLEFGQYVSVPYCAELFAHGGADVTKVEPVTGDETRKNSEILPGEGRQYIIKARGKRGLPLDISTPEGNNLARRLALRSDILVSNMRPGALESLGLDFESLSAENPSLIVGEISAFGRQGPDAIRPGLDAIAQAYSGLTFSGRAWDDGVPVTSEAFLADYMAGMTLAFGLVTALRERDRTGRGQVVRTSLLQASLTLQHGTASIVEAVDGWKRTFLDSVRSTGASLESFQVRRNELAGNRWFYNNYATADGFVAVAAPGPNRRKLMDLLEIDDPQLTQPGWVMPDDPRDYLASILAAARAAVLRFDTTTFEAACAERGIPCSRMRFLEETLVDEGVRSNGFLHEFDHPAVGPMVMPGAPLSFSSLQFKPADNSPAYGEHTDDLLAEFGLAPAEVARLVAARITGTPGTSPFTA